MMEQVYKKIAAKNPDLFLKLRQARMGDSPEYFIKKTFFTASYMTMGLVFILFGFFGKSGNKSIIGFIFLSIPILLIIVFFYFLHIPDVKRLRIDRDISKEVVFAGRFLIIEINSGVNLYDAMNNVAINFPNVGQSFRNVTNKIDLGTNTEDALNEEIEMTPSNQLRKILWQIMNSLRTGADISQSLESVLEQMVRHQIIEVNEYGKKLNPLAMFYMMIAVILPSIGISMFIVLTTFISLEIKLYVLLIVAFFLGFIQLMFVMIIRNKRPAVEL